jgi:hypothetical protein
MESDQASTVRRVNVEEVTPRPRIVHPTPLSATNPPSTEATPPPIPSSTLDVLVAAFGGLGYALSARALLLLALIGAFVIGLKAMEVQTPLSMAGLAIYAAFTVIPTAYLEIVRRRA